MKKETKVIIIISIVLPLLVTILYLLPGSKSNGYNILPLINACINGLTSIFLIFGFIAIKKKKFILHKKMMIIALILSILFLLLYVLYHSLTVPKVYGGKETIKYIYYFILLTHILLAIVIVPLVLITLVRAFSEKYDKHKKIAKITLPLWLYVSITGVIVYLMISPYYL